MATFEHLPSEILNIISEYDKWNTFGYEENNFYTYRVCGLNKFVRQKMLSEKCDTSNMTKMIQSINFAKKLTIHITIHRIYNGNEETDYAQNHFKIRNKSDVERLAKDCLCVDLIIHAYPIGSQLSLLDENLSRVCKIELLYKKIFDYLISIGVKSINIWDNSRKIVRVPFISFSCINIAYAMNIRFTGSSECLTTFKTSKNFDMNVIQAENLENLECRSIDNPRILRSLKKLTIEKYDYMDKWTTSLMFPNLEYFHQLHSLIACACPLDKPVTYSKFQNLSYRNGVITFTLELYKNECLNNPYVLMHKYLAKYIKFDDALITIDEKQTFDNVIKQENLIFDVFRTSTYMPVCNAKILIVKKNTDPKLFFNMKPRSIVLVDMNSTFIQEVIQNCPDFVDNIIIYTNIINIWANPLDDSEIYDMISPNQKQKIYLQNVEVDDIGQINGNDDKLNLCELNHAYIGEFV